MYVTHVLFSRYSNYTRHRSEKVSNLNVYVAISRLFLPLGMTSVGHIPTLGVECRMTR